jgi:hypothetical protein
MSWFPYSFSLVVIPSVELVKCLQDVGRNLRGVALAVEGVTPAPE